MAKRFHKFRFNERTLQMEELPFALRDFLLFGFKKLLFFSCIAGSSILVFDRYFESPADRVRERELEFVESQLDRMAVSVTDMGVILEDISRRDDAIYRAIFGTDPYPEHLRNPGIGGSDQMRDLRGFSHSEVVISLENTVAELQRKLVAQSRSFDDVLALAQNRTEMLKSIPAIQPVRNEDLRRMASGYGYRIHPIYKVRKMHHGMDFAAPTGTEIFATGDGKVVLSKRLYNGFGRHVIIKHGFGYETLYAHMSKTLVKKGQRVKRGEVIGLVGSTGTSSAPHLHYEVHKDDKRVNPAPYFFNDLSPEQYEEMLAKVEDSNQSFD
ncbi:MAG: M23 family metallopeptidase [Flavobacteriales bacterium]|nr:M23 family metallopeptidase [Flavobacteriales bacterium]